MEFRIEIQEEGTSGSEALVQAFFPPPMFCQSLEGEVERRAELSETAPQIPNEY
jgi:hypothetical protein